MWLKMIIEVLFLFLHLYPYMSIGNLEYAVLHLITTKVDCTLFDI